MMTEQYHPERYTIMIGGIEAKGVADGEFIEIGPNDFREFARPYVARAVPRAAFLESDVDAILLPPLAMPEAMRLAVDQYTIALTTAEELHRDIERCLGTDEPLRVRNARGPRRPLAVHYVDK
jgi:hypothetical protein